MSVNIHHITWHHIPENSIIKSQKQETLKILIIFSYYTNEIPKIVAVSECLIKPYQDN